jgi:hypothetical protein
MHGVALRVPRTVRPRGLNTPPSASQTPGVTGEEGRFDPAVRAEKHVRGRNRTATVDAGRESVLHRRGNAQPEYPLRGIPPL